MGKSVIPCLERRSKAGFSTQCLWFPKGSQGGKQVLLVSDSTARTFRRSFLYFPSILVHQILCKRKSGHKSWQRSPGHRGGGRILNPDEKAKNNNQQFSDNLSTCSNLWSRLAGNNTQSILSDKTD